MANYFFFSATDYNAKVKTSLGGIATLQFTNTASDHTITLPAATGTVMLSTAPHTFNPGEVIYVDALGGLTSEPGFAYNDTTNVFTVPSVTASGLTASRAVTTGVGGLLSVSAVTDTELGYVSGVTSSIQTQLNTKISASSAVDFSNTISVIDNNFSIKGSSDVTKIAKFEVDGFTTATTRTVTLPDANIVVAGSAAALTSGRVPTATTGGLLIDTFLASTVSGNTATFAGAMGAARVFTLPDASITVAGSAAALTSGRVPYATTGGLLTDDSGFAITGAPSVDGLRRWFFDNTGSGASRHASIAIRTNSSNTEALFIGVNQTTSALATIDNRSGGPLQIQQTGTANVTFYASSGVHIGNTPSDPGSGVLNVQGQIKAGQAITATGAAGTQLIVQSTQASTSTTTGCATFAGGIGVAGAGWFGTAVNIGTDIAQNGNAARTYSMSRHTTANTAGNNLTVNAGGATSGATDKAGGSLLLKPGVSTGTGIGGYVALYGNERAASTGTTDNAQAERFIVMPVKNLTDNVATGLFEVSLPSNSAASGSFEYGIECTDGTDYQVHVGYLVWGAVNKAGVITSSFSHSSGVGGLELEVDSTGTFSDTWSLTNGASKITLNLNANSSLTPTVLRVRGTISNHSTQTITLL